MQQCSAWPFPKILLHKTTYFKIDVIPAGETIIDVLRLRYEIFHDELGYHTDLSPNNVEKDCYDDYCDHLIVSDLNKQSVVATYRLLRHDVAQKHNGFYSDTEFTLNYLHNQNMHLLETGRACIKHNYRHQFIISFLWKGLATYATYHQLDYLGGCTSIGSKSPEFAKIIFHYANHLNALLPETWNVVSLPANRIEDFFNKKEPVIHNISEMKRVLPGLLRSYVNLGAKISREPAFDANWSVIDFYTLLDLKTIHKRALHFF